LTRWFRTSHSTFLIRRLLYAPTDKFLGIKVITTDRQIQGTIYRLEWLICRTIVVACSPADIHLTVNHQPSIHHCPFRHWSVKRIYWQISCELLTELYLIVLTGPRNCKIGLIHFLARWCKRRSELGLCFVSFSFEYWSFKINLLPALLGCPGVRL